MWEDLFEDMFGDYDNVKIIESREVASFKLGEGTWNRCMEKYIEMEKQTHRKNGELLNVRCGHLTNEEEVLFNNVLFDLLFDEDYVTITVWGAKLYLDLQELSKVTGLTTEVISNILFGISMIQIVIESDVREGFFSVSSLFPGAESGPCINLETGKYEDEDILFVLTISLEFFKACTEIKHQMNRD